VPDGEVYFITANLAQRGGDALIRDDAFSTIQESVDHYTAQGLWHVRLLVIMPDHIHALMSLNTRTKSISTIIGGWKRYLSKKVGLEWQKNFFEHRIRNQNELMEKESYLLNNPVRAGLCEKQVDWPYVIRSVDTV
jgi:REP element-mobilizing transposase RayT